jgi:hypothetical protein
MVAELARSPLRILVCLNACSVLLHEVITQAHRVAVAEGVSDEGYRVVFNTGPQAGQTVPHVHAMSSADAPSPGPLAEPGRITWSA